MEEKFSFFFLVANALQKKLFGKKYDLKSANKLL